MLVLALLAAIFPGPLNPVVVMFNVAAVAERDVSVFVAVCAVLINVFGMVATTLGWTTYIVPSGKVAGAVLTSLIVTGTCSVPIGVAHAYLAGPTEAAVASPPLAKPTPRPPITPRPPARSDTPAAPLTNFSKRVRICCFLSSPESWAVSSVNGDLPNDLAMHACVTWPPCPPPAC